MFTYEEINNYRIRYYFKNNGKNERKLYDSKEDEFVEDGSEIEKILAALSVSQTLADFKQKEFTAFFKPPYNTAEEEKAWDSEQIKQLQENMLKVLSSDNYEFELLTDYDSIEKIFLEQLAKPTNNDVTKRNEALMSYLLGSIGKKMVSYDANAILRSDLARKIYKFKFTVADKSFAEKLNPKDMQYTQPPKAKKITNEGRANRRRFAEELITYYKMMESDSAYEERVQTEDARMTGIANIVNNNKSVTNPKSGRKLMDVLMAAQNLSLTGEKDYFEYMISQEEISKLLYEIKTSGRFDTIKQQAEKNKSEGKVREGRVDGHDETIGERCTRFANIEIAKNPNTVAEVKKQLTANPTKEFYGINPTPYIWAAVSRLSGKSPVIKVENGKTTFSEDGAFTR